MRSSRGVAQMHDLPLGPVRGRVLGTPRSGTFIPASRDLRTWSRTRATPPRIVDHRPFVATPPIWVLTGRKGPRIRWAAMVVRANSPAWITVGGPARGAAFEGPALACARPAAGGALRCPPSRRRVEKGVPPAGTQDAAHLGHDAGGIGDRAEHGLEITASTDASGRSRRSATVACSSRSIRARAAADRCPRRYRRSVHPTGPSRTGACGRRPARNQAPTVTTTRPSRASSYQPRTTMPTRTSACPAARAGRNGVVVEMVVIGGTRMCRWALTRGLGHAAGIAAWIVRRRLDRRRRERSAASGSSSAGSSGTGTFGSICGSGSGSGADHRDQ